LWCAPTIFDVPTMIFFQWIFYYIAALAVFVRSSAAYEALKSFTVTFSLNPTVLHRCSPSCSWCLYWINIKANGVIQNFNTAMWKGRKLIPKSDRELIFDEVPVVIGLIWNLKNQRMQWKRETSQLYIIYFNVCLQTSMFSYATVFVERLNIFIWCSKSFFQ